MDLSKDELNMLITSTSLTVSAISNGTVTRGTGFAYINKKVKELKDLRRRCIEEFHKV